jgi:pimeloyl-ACP methyl ester carboxylesterase
VLAAAGVPVRVIDAAGREPEPDVAGLRALCDYDARPLEGVGHFPMLERPAAFKAVLARWIDELARPREAAAR